MALVHHPVVNKNGDEIASAVTNLDLHDIARACKTYGVADFFVVTPLEDQKHLIRRILEHWTDGFGGRYNPKRRQALELIKLADSLDDAVAQIEAQGRGKPQTVATCARNRCRGIGYVDLRRRLMQGEPHLLAFGTAWGLSERILAQVDAVLPPVTGATSYNHLSVRSAAAIILDRLAGGESAAFV